MIFNIFQELLSDNSRLAKEAVLRRNINNVLLQRVCHLALNPYIKFWVRKIPSKFEGRNSVDLNTALDKISKLSSRKITGNAAVSFLEDIFHSLSFENAQILKKVIEKDLKCGVSTSTINKIWPGLIPEFEIQLSAVYESKNLPERFGIEPKLDGMRVTILCDNDGEITFNSRGGKEIETLDHLKSQLMELNNNIPGFMFDAEAISGDFQNTMSVVKRLGKNSKNEKIFLYIFDHMSYDEFSNQRCGLNFEERRKNLELLFGGKNFPNLKLNDIEYYEPSFGDKHEFVLHVFNKMRKDGFEGSIVKDLNGIYEFKRTIAWQKVKPIDTVDVRIKGYYAGNKGTKNEHRLGGFTFDYEDVECRVGGGFSDAQRDEFWLIKDQMIDAWMEVEFMEKTNKGATRHCNFIALRDFKGEKS